MALVKSRAIVLRTYRLGETSKVVVCYTEDHGKVRLVAKGARKGGGRLGAALEPLMVSGVVFYKRPGRELSLVSQAEIEREFPALRRDVVRMAYGSAVLELVNKLVSGEEPDAALFGLVVGALEEMDGVPPAELDPSLWRFELAIATALGYTPEFARCVVCGGEPGDEPRFAPRLGGVVCRNCLAARPEIHTAGSRAAALLTRLARGEGPAPGEIAGSALSDEVAETLREFLEEHTGRQLKLKSIDFLAQVRRVEHSGTEPDRDDER